MLSNNVHLNDETTAVGKALGNTLFMNLQILPEACPICAIGVFVQMAAIENTLGAMNITPDMAEANPNYFDSPEFQAKVAETVQEITDKIKQVSTELMTGGTYVTH